MLPCRPRNARAGSGDGISTDVRRCRPQSGAAFQQSACPTVSGLCEVLDSEAEGKCCVVPLENPVPGAVETEPVQVRPAPPWLYDMRADRCGMSGAVPPSEPDSE